MPKRYKVIGEQAIFDHDPGESFDADLPDDQEQFLVGIGAIKVISSDVASDKRINPETVTRGRSSWSNPKKD